MFYNLCCSTCTFLKNFYFTLINLFLFEIRVKVRNKVISCMTLSTNAIFLNSIQYNIYRIKSDQANAIDGLMSPNCHVDGSFDCVDATVFIHVSATPDTKCTPFTSDCLSTCIFGFKWNSSI